MKKLLKIVQAIVLHKKMELAIIQIVVKEVDRDGHFNF